MIVCFAARKHWWVFPTQSTQNEKPKRASSSRWLVGPPAEQPFPDGPKIHSNRRCVIDDFVWLYRRIERCARDRRLFISAVQPTCSLYGVTTCFPAVRAHSISVFVCSRFILTVVLMSAVCLRRQVAWPYLSQSLVPLLVYSTSRSTTEGPLYLLA